MSTVWDILQQPLPPFTFPNDEDDIKNRKLLVPPARQGTTAMWAATSVGRLRLLPTPWNWKFGDEYTKFTAAAKGYKEEIAISDIPFKYPRTEGDIA